MTFYKLDALPVTRQTASEHWNNILIYHVQGVPKNCTRCLWQ